MKNRWLLGSISLMLTGTVFSADLTVYPIPQEMKELGKDFFIENGASKWQGDKLANATTVQLLKKYFAKKQVNFIIGESADPGMAKYDKVPKISGGYYLKIEKNQIIVVGHDETGTFYAAKTLLQLLKNNKEQNVLPSVEIIDFPDVEFRGTVEGFYGKPWGHQDRISQIKFYGDHKLNTYIYGPKNDPFHGFSNRWREPYPADQAEKMKELVKVAKENKVNFVWAIHPGAHIFWHDKDGDGVIDDFVNCRKKFELMYDLGVRSFALFFDDIGGEGARPEKQAEMLNYLNKEFVQAKGDVTPLIFCPTAYFGFNKNYMEVLGNKLDQDVHVMWTGRGICVDIRKEDVVRINNLMKRKVFIWWNWPVSDYCRTQLLLGKTYGNSIENAPLLSGFVSNPMDKPEASKIALFGVADYTWNMKKFNSETSWHAGIRQLYPDVAEEMQLFANHNSDQGNNGHGYRREESVAFKPVIDQAMKQYREQGTFNEDIAEALQKEFRAMINASQVLLKELPTLNPAMYEETENWIKSFGHVGRMGDYCVRMATTQNAKMKLHYSSLLVDEQETMDQIFEAQRQKGLPDQWARGCKTASLVVTPFINEIISKENKKAYEAYTGKKANENTVQQYKAFSNVERLSHIQASRKGKYVNLDRILEVITLEPGQYIGLQLPSGVFANYVHLKLENPKASQQGIVEISKDGKKWEKMNTRNSGQEIQNNLDVNLRIRWMRYINTSKEPIEIKANLFKFDIPEDAKINSKEAMFDGDLSSSFVISHGSHMLQAPAGTKEVVVIAPKKALAEQIIINTVDGKSRPYIAYLRTREVKQPVKSITLNSKEGKLPVKIYEIIWK